MKLKVMVLFCDEVADYIPALTTALSEDPDYSFSFRNARYGCQEELYHKIFYLKKMGTSPFHKRFNHQGIKPKQVQTIIPVEYLMKEIDEMYWLTSSQKMERRAKEIKKDIDGKLRRYW